MAITLSVILIDCVYLADPHRAVRPNCDWGQVQMVRQRSQIKKKTPLFFFPRYAHTLEPVSFVVWDNLSRWRWQVDVFKILTTHFLNKGRMSLFPHILPLFTFLLIHNLYSLSKSFFEAAFPFPPSPWSPIIFNWIKKNHVFFSLNAALKSLRETEVNKIFIGIVDNIGSIHPTSMSILICWWTG